MKDLSAAVKDLMPFAGVLLGFVLGWLTTIIKDVRDRRRTANSLIFVLLRMRLDIRRLDPELLVTTYIGFLVEKFRLTSSDAIPREAIRSVLAPVIQQEMERTLVELRKEYSAAVTNFAPYRPIVAYRLSGEDVARFQAMIQIYFQEVMERPDVKADASAPAIVNVVKQDTIDLARRDAIDALAQDLRSVAKASSFWRRFEVARAVRRQNRMISDVLVREFAKQMDAPFTALIQKVSALSQSPPAASAGADAGVAPGHENK